MDDIFYGITKKTCALIALSKEKTKVLEQERELIINKPPLEIIKENCEYYGSTFEGRIINSKKQLGMCYKLPLIIDGHNEIIMFPTISYDNEECCWIALKNIHQYCKKDNNTIINFFGEKQYTFQMSYEMLENQMFRATKLMMIMQNRYSIQN